jgi:hypothetical protein
MTIPRPIYTGIATRMPLRKLDVVSKLVQSLVDFRPSPAKTFIGVSRTKRSNDPRILLRERVDLETSEPEVLPHPVKQDVPDIVFREHNTGQLKFSERACMPFQDYAHPCCSDCGGTDRQATELDRVEGDAELLKQWPSLAWPVATIGMFIQRRHGQ